MFKVNQPEKALYKVGQRVTCDYEPGVTYKVAKKHWDMFGTVFYEIHEVNGVRYMSGLRQKFLNNA